MTTAVNTFTRQCPREERQIRPYDDYRAKIELSLRQADEGRLTRFTMDELELLENTETESVLEFIEARRKESGV